MPKRVWVTWENQRRNRTLSKALGAQLLQFDLKRHRIIRYPMSFLLTLSAFIRLQPAFIFAQNPSLVLASLAVSYGRLFNIPVIIDAHNAGVFPFNNRRWANKLAAHLFKHATFTIVTNKYLADYVREKSGNPAILPDPLPEFDPPPSRRTLKGDANILFICSWADDEPYGEVIKAAELLGKTAYVYITGNSRGREKACARTLPGNVILTGYLQEKEYIEMLYSCNAIVDLTTRKDCLVCGAYEAVAAEKPLIISDNEVSRQYFSRGVLYTNNTCADIAEQIKKALTNRNDLTEEIRILKGQMKTAWEHQRQAFEKKLQNIRTS